MPPIYGCLSFLLHPFLSLKQRAPRGSSSHALRNIEILSSVLSVHSKPESKEYLKWRRRTRKRKRERTRWRKEENQGIQAESVYSRCGVGREVSDPAPRQNNITTTLRMHACLFLSVQILFEDVLLASSFLLGVRRKS